MLHHVQLSHEALRPLFDTLPWFHRRCNSEHNISSELTARLQAVPRIAAKLATLPPKMYALSSKEPAAPIDPRPIDVEQAIERIEKAHFMSGMKDKTLVVNLYKDYVSRLATVLQKVLVLPAGRPDDGQALSLPPMPTLQELPTPGQALPHAANWERGAAGVSGLVFFLLLPARAQSVSFVASQREPVRAPRACGLH